LCVADLLKAMLLDVSADHFRRDLVTHCPSKRAIFPEFPAPQTPLDAWELAKDGPGTQTLEPGHDLRDGVPWRKGAEDMDMGRCFRAVDSISDEEPKFIAIDEEAKHQIVHSRRFGKANGATYEPFDPGAQIDVLAFDPLRVLFADYVLLRGDMPLVGTPPIRVKPCDTKWGQQALEFEKDGILPASKDIG